MPKYEHTLSQQLDQVRQVVARGDPRGLWYAVNRAIRRVLQNGIRNHYSRKRIAHDFYSIAGPRKRGEPACLSNYRCAARLIEEGGDLSCLT